MIWVTEPMGLPFDGALAKRVCADVFGSRQYLSLAYRRGVVSDATERETS
ncbi:hypothetical protein [Halogeometricum limi]|uniref:Uncharacterized protein n=1 Tax=Halogeometricum limi TaxID=555875 RepID=A0A1I6GN94_9EURY|nr:hypothetical protein [Halogeometricum limi]SFR43695.1 hypothetical protein SAMN04488124_1309 [Halogeometricum limi]